MHALYEIMNWPIMFDYLAVPCIWCVGGVMKDYSDNKRDQCSALA